jgi:hypothetical protein
VPIHRKLGQNRAIPSGSEPLLAEFVANLVWRTKNIRQRFTGLADTARDEALIQASNDNFYYNELARPYVDIERTKQLGDHAPRRVRKLWEKEQRKRLKEIRPVAFRVIENISLTSAVQDAQVRFLEALPEHIPQAYMQLQWAISTSDHGPLILGDIGPLWRKEGETRFSVPLPYMIHEGGRLFLPISRSLLLVGYSPGSNQDTTVDYEQVNVGSARLSSEFFISAQNTDRECRYHALVGADRDDWMRQIAQQDLLNL